MYYNKIMKNDIHRKDSDVRQHLTFHKNSTQPLKPKILYVGELKRTKTWKEQQHEHDFLEILFVRSGEGTVFIGEKTLPIRTGDLLVFNPHLPHYEAGKELSFYFFGVSNIRLENMRENYLLTEDACPVIHTENDAELFELLFSHLIYEAESKLYFYDEISSNIVKILLAHIRRMLAYGNESYFKTNESYKQAKEFIDKNFAEIKSIDDVCRHMYISRFYLTHLFKEYSGVSPLKYILIKRMEQAKELLTDTDLPIGEISLLSGYAEINSFIKTFKNIESVTPAAYRSAHKHGAAHADGEAHVEGGAHANSGAHADSGAHAEGEAHADDGAHAEGDTTEEK